MNSLYPFQSHYLDLDGLRLHYLDEGQGEPVLMLHGNPTWSFYFRNLIPPISQNFRVIVPDHIGCGLSEKPGDARYEYSLEQRAADIESLLEHLDIKRDINLVLHDWGGAIGMAYAVRHPQRIKRIVMMNSAAFHIPPAKKIPFALKLARNTRLGAFLVRGLNLFCLSAARVCAKKRPLPKDVRQGYIMPYDSWANRIAVLRFVQDIPLSKSHQSFQTLTETEGGLGKFRDTPILVCWGELDFVFDRPCLEEWRRRWPHADFHCFPEAGHYVLEDEAETLIPLIQDFLSGKSERQNVTA